jgi:CRP/FNR family transcriptional regulator, cyclic AMP receptor protein
MATSGRAALRQVPLFSVLEDRLLGALAEELDEAEFPVGTQIFPEGDTSATLYVIRSGKVKVVRSNDTEEVILAVLGDGDYFGELSLCDGSPRSAGVVALQPTSAYVLSRETFLRFVRDHPPAAVHLLAVLATRLRHTSERLSETVFLPVEARIAKRLAELAREHGGGDAAETRIPITVEELAPLAGATAAQVEAELRALQEGGILSWNGSSVTVCALALLEERTWSGPRYVGLGHVNVPRWLLEP